MADWNAIATDWVTESPGMARVTQLHWEAKLSADGKTARVYGVTPDNGNRVYTQAALGAVPESVVVGWIQQALGVERIGEIEAELNARLDLLLNPPGGTIIY